MKRCGSCGTSKPMTDFNRSSRSKDGRQPQCRACSALHYQANRDRYIKNIRISNIARRKRAYRYLWEYLLQHPCVDCGEADPFVLEFDHVRGQKIDDVKRLATHGKSVSMIEAEVDKCDVRCANCHRRKTVKQFGWYDWLIEEASVA